MYEFTYEYTHSRVVTFIDANVDFLKNKRSKVNCMQKIFLLSRSLKYFTQIMNSYFGMHKIL